MTIEPITDERLAEIRAGLEGAEEFDRVQYFSRTILALLSRLDKAEAGWQPIETAPKDGTIVDLWARVFGPVSRDNDEARVYVEFRVPAARLAAGGWTNEDGNSLDLEGWDGLVFTHWRPLPPPPSES